jgi:hypothetical protein
MAFGKSKKAHVPTPAPTARGRSRFSGVPGQGDTKYPILRDGEFQAKILKTYVTDRTGAEYFHADLEIVESTNPVHRVGSHASILKCLSGRAGTFFGLPLVVSLTAAADGCESEAQFREKYGDVSDELCDAVCGDPAAAELHGENPLAGAIVNIVGTPSAQKEGVQFYDYTFLPEAD